MKKKLIFIILMLAVVTLVGLLVLYMVGRSSSKLNKTVNIKEDKVKITVLESEKVIINNKDLQIGDYTWKDEVNGNYIKVKLSIENYGSETYNFNAAKFYLGEDSIALATMAEKDWIAESIQSGKTETGYIYFPVNDSKIMTYYTQMEVTNSSTAKQAKYNFKIR